MQVKKWFLLCTLLGTNRSSPLTSVWLLYSLLLAYSLCLISSAMGSRSSKWFVNLMVSDDESGQVHEMFLASPHQILWHIQHQAIFCGSASKCIISQVVFNELHPILLLLWAINWSQNAISLLYADWEPWRGGSDFFSWLGASLTVSLFLVTPRSKWMTSYMSLILMWFSWRWGEQGTDIASPMMCT